MSDAEEAKFLQAQTWVESWDRYHAGYTQLQADLQLPEQERPTVLTGPDLTSAGVLAALGAAVAPQARRECVASRS